MEYSLIAPRDGIIKEIFCKNGEQVTENSKLLNLEKIKFIVIKNFKQKYSIFSLARNSLSYHKNWNKAWRSPNPKKNYDIIINATSLGLKNGQDFNFNFDH